MNKSESIKELATALAKAQGELKNPHFDAVNPHFKSKFASLAAVREAVIPVFSKHGLSVSQWPLGSDGHAGCKTILAHSSGEWIHESFIIPVERQTAHGYASAVTYTKRISLQSIAAVVGDDDDDGNAAVADPVAKAVIDAKVTPTSGTREQLKPEQLKRVETCAGEVLDCFNGGYSAEQALAMIDECDFDADEKAALSTFFDSKQRTALRKARQAQPKTDVRAPLAVATSP